MQPWIATATGVGLVVITQLLTAAFIYGKLTERVSFNSEKTNDHGRRLANIETVLSGTGGHGERLTALEAWRLENLKK